MAQLIDNLSQPSTVSVLDLFSVPSTQVAVEDGYWQEVHLVNTCTSAGPWTFIVQSDPHYLHLNRNYIYFKCKITSATGAAIAAGDKVGPINLLGKTLFRQVKVGINGKLAYDSGSMYAYRTFLESHLNYGKEAKEGILAASLYTKDEPSDKVDNDNNTGFAKRKAKFALSTVVEVMAPIHCDLFMSDRLLMSQSEVTLELHRNDDDFVLLNYAAAVAPATEPTKYRLEILEMKWFIRKIQLLGSVQLGLEAAVNKTPAKYPIRRVTVTKIHISVGRQNAPTTPVFNGQIPRRVVIGFVKHDAYFGAVNKSPFKFENCGVREISVHAGGRLYPREPLKMTFSKDLYTRAYIQMLEGLGIADENKGNDISMTDFKENSCLFVFDLSPEEMDSGHWQLLREGSTVVHCEFENAIDGQGLEMIVYAEYDNLALIDRNRIVHFDYTS